MELHCYNRDQQLNRTGCITTSVSRSQEVLCPFAICMLQREKYTEMYVNSHVNWCVLLV